MEPLQIKVKTHSLLLTSTMFASCHFMGAAEDTRPIGEAKDSTARGTASGRGFGPRCSPVRLGATRSRGARCRPRRESEP